MDSDQPIENFEEFKRSLIARMRRCAEMIVAKIERSWEHCGKASCARSRRCRGFACEVETGDDKNLNAIARGGERF